MGGSEGTRNNKILLPIESHIGQPLLNSVPDEEHLKIIRQGAAAWNEWRWKNLDIKVDLSEADLSGANLIGVLLIGADLSGADLSDADLSDADLSKADLTGAFLSRAFLRNADL